MVVTVGKPGSIPGVPDYARLRPWHLTTGVPVYQQSRYPV
jgi:hypothetical protein